MIIDNKTGQGRNLLGQILMETREQLKEKIKCSNYCNGYPNECSSICERDIDL